MVDRRLMSSSTEEVSISGSVTVKGKKATGGEISFNPANVQRKNATLRTAKIGTDGTYSLKTLVGENQVRVRGPQVDKDPTLSQVSKNVEIKSGETSVPIELP